jgi:hypothetical protein
MEFGLPERQRFSSTTKGALGANSSAFLPLVVLKSGDLIIERDVRFSSRYGVIGLRLYTRARTVSYLEPRRGVGKFDPNEMFGKTCASSEAACFRLDDQL